MNLQDIEKVNILVERRSIHYAEREPEVRLLNPNGKAGVLCLQTKVKFQDDPLVYGYQIQLTERACDKVADYLMRGIETSLEAIQQKREEPDDE